MAFWTTLSGWLRHLTIGIRSVKDMAIALLDTIVPQMPGNIHGAIEGLGDRASDKGK